jgi:hypothetical protein
MNILSIVTEPLSRAYEAYQARKIKERELKDAAHARVVDRIKHSEDLEQAVTLAQIQNSGWKDEWFTILFSVPLVIAFFPGLVPYLVAGFQALEQMPVWYKAYLGAAVTASFGLKTVDRAWKWWKSP